MTEEEYKQTELTSIDYQEKLDAITIDLVNPNEQQPEIEHKMKFQNSHSDYSSEAGMGWREIVGEGCFSYEMTVDKKKQIYLAVTYWGSDKECFIDGERCLREFNIYANDNLISEELLNENKPYAFLINSILDLKN